mgnify:CR=1 FL=1
MNQQLKSYLWMSLAISSFCLLATIANILSQDYSAVQSVFVRACVGFIFITPILFIKKETIDFSLIKLHSLRNLTHLIGQLAWFTGFAYLSVAQVIAIEFSVPIWVLFLAAYFLKEQITLIKLFSIILGFIAILFIVQPTMPDFHPMSLLVLGGAFAYAIAHTTNKNISSKTSALLIIWFMAWMQMLATFPFAIYYWRALSINDFLWMVVLGLTALSGHFCLSKAIQNIPVSSAMIFDYFRLPLMIIIGWLVFSQTIEWPLALGVILILCANLILAIPKKWFKNDNLL